MRMRIPVPDLSDTSNLLVRRLIIGTVSFASLIGALDMSVVNISVPVIIRDWQIPIGLGSLIILSYLLTLTVLILVMGKLADRYGFRNLFLSGLFVFGLGSVLCGFAPDIYFLIGSRVIQATGAAMLTAVSPAIITRYLPDSDRGKSLGYLIACAAVGYAIGPGLGGLITSYFSWRWIFYVNLPVVIFGLLLGYYVIPRDPPGQKHRPFDIPGALLFIAAMAGILGSFSFFQVAGTPDSVLEFLFVAGLACGVLFFARDRKDPDPLLFSPMIRNRNFTFGLVTCFIITALFSGVTYLMPLYLVNSRHLEPFLAGMIMMIPALFSMIAAPVSGSLADRYGSPIVSAVSIGISAVGFILIYTFNPTTAVVFIIIAMIITRVSTASFFGPNGRLIMGHCTPETIGTGSGMMMAVRHAGLVCGIALFQSVFAIRMYLEGIPRDGTPLVPRLTPAMSVLGYEAVYIVAFVLCIVVVIISLKSKDASPPSDTTEYGDTSPPI
jgi:EmrB/QacA subfamily drug resistance transporter